MNSYWKRQVLMFYSLGKKNTKKNSEGGGNHPHSPPPHKYVQGLKKKSFVSLRPDEEICLIYAH